MENMANDQRPHAQMNQHIREIENIVPVGDALNVDEVNNSMVENAVADIAHACSDDDSETEAIKKIRGLVGENVNRYSGQNRAAEYREKRAVPRKHAKGSA